MILGVDPGEHGAIALWASARELVGVVRLDGGRVPVVAWPWFAPGEVVFYEPPPVVAGRASVSSALKQGANAGEVAGFARGRGCRVLAAPPGEWQKIAGIPPLRGFTRAAAKRERDRLGRLKIVSLIGETLPDGRAVLCLSSGEVDACLIGWAGFVLDGRARR